MNTHLRPLLALGLAVALGTSTPSSTAAPAARGLACGCDLGQANGTGCITTRVASLHAMLKLNAEQETAWVALLKSATEPTPASDRPSRSALAALSAPERMAEAIAIAKTRLTTAEARLTSLTGFYATLSPEQKKTFDEQSMGGMRGPRCAMGRMRHGAAGPR
jgi:protein CpxP